MAAKTKVTTGKKLKPQVNNKFIVRDACAADGCTKVPAKGSSFCAEHTTPVLSDAQVKEVRAELGKLIEAGNATPMQKALVSAADKIEKVVKAAAKRAPKKAKAKELLVVATDAAEKPMAPTTGKAKQVDVTLGNNASEPIKQLQAKGWTLNSIAGALGTSPGRVWFWAHGKPCRRIGDILALVFKDVPRKGLVLAKSKRTPVAAKSAYNPKLDDPNQLLLALQALVRRSAR